MNWGKLCLLIELGGGVTPLNPADFVVTSFYANGVFLVHSLTVLHGTEVMHLDRHISGGWIPSLGGKRSPHPLPSEKALAAWVEGNSKSGRVLYQKAKQFLDTLKVVRTTSSRVLRMLPDGRVNMYLGVRYPIVARSREELERLDQALVEEILGGRK